MTHITLPAAFSALANRIAALPESVVFGGTIFGVCAFALALSVALVWFRNWRRLVPRPYEKGDYARAAGVLLLISFVIAVTAGIGWAALRPLYRISPALAALAPGVLVAVAVVVLAARSLRHRG